MVQNKRCEIVMMNKMIKIPIRIGSNVKFIKLNKSMSCKQVIYKTLMQCKLDKSARCHLNTYYLFEIVNGVERKVNFNENMLKLYLKNKKFIESNELRYHHYSNNQGDDNDTTMMVEYKIRKLSKTTIKKRRNCLNKKFYVFNKSVINSSKCVKTRLNRIANMKNKINLKNLFENINKNLLFKYKKINSKCNSFTSDNNKNQFNLLNIFLKKIKKY